MEVSSILETGLGGGAIVIVYSVIQFARELHKSKRTNGNGDPARRAGDPKVDHIEAMCETLVRVHEESNQSLDWHCPKKQIQQTMDNSFDVLERVKNLERNTPP